MGKGDDFTGNEDIIFIQKAIKNELNLSYSENDITYVVDLIYEYYDKIGMFSDEDIDEDSDVLINEDELTEFVISCLKEDGVNNITPDMVRNIVVAEFAYCQSIGIFTDEE